MDQTHFESLLDEIDAELIEGLSQEEGKKAGTGSLPLYLAPEKEYKNAREAAEVVEHPTL